LHKKGRIVLVVILSLLAFLIVTFRVAVFSDNPLVRKWRNIYIETAMSTMSHQWLATKFIPLSVIDEVMNEKDAVQEEQSQMESVWNEGDFSSPKTEPEGASDFFSEFSELSKSSFNKYIEEHPDLLKDGYSKLLINESGLKDSGTDIYTTAGDQVLAVDAANGILIVKVTGKGYNGKLAILKDASRVRLASSNRFGSMGETVKNIAADNKAVLAINASGFSDADGVGNGGTIYGLLISNGKLLSKASTDKNLTIGFDKANKLYIGATKSYSSFRDAIEFSPAEVINGKNVTDGSTGFGIQPRSSIGQKQNGDVLLLTVDGRQVGYSLGCTVGDCAEIMLRYGVVQACNLDGGSSTVMVYRGSEITRPANGYSFGRYVPDAFIFEAAR